ncbi:lasso peptide biosynthesis B2 protein [Fischerella sp. PCC 9605]|uniref:lasso peptide biosynthesis B2 protein n=1 Tax=Fischerella sp. PCC 9605 TaxID=1173024 RepID=UPI000478DE02|nr:lasso peptide biosynthesis B2 protein [Fischerella sp. PCC 9605]
MRRLHKLLRLGAGERNLLVTTLILLGGVRLGLWLLPFRNLLKLLEKISQPSRRSHSPNQVTLSKIIWAVNAVTRCMPGVKCLARALTTHVIMNQYGYASQLRIGVAKTELGKLEAHAWIEHQGRVVIGNLSDLYRFIPLPSLEGVKL